MPQLQKPKIERIKLTVTLADKVFDALIQLIGNGDYPHGSRLPSEAKMAERFGVSRTVIREAVSRLKSEGMVESRQGSGVYVRQENTDSPFRIDPSIMDSLKSIMHLVELRKVLEGEMAALAATRRSKAQMQAIVQALKKIDEDVAAGGDGVEADIAFHRSIAEATGNPLFLALTGFLFNFLRKATFTTRRIEAKKSSLSQQVDSEHRNIAEAISRRDPDAASAAARLHMDRLTQRLASVNITELMCANVDEVITDSD